ncbi:MAG: sulfite exporter TauE/SafE family protein [Candidatus Sericytochromatia bacterium]
MLDLFSQPTALAAYSWYWVPGLVLMASVLGSLHCAGMCGGIVMALPPRRSVQVSYHLGRLLGYLGLGALAGLLGQQFLRQAGLLAGVASLVMAVILFSMALRIWRGQPLHLRLPAALQKALQLPLALSLSGSRRPGPGGTLLGGSVGLLTVLLPCGWLYSFVIGAVMTRQPVLGAAYLVAFWAGTLPALAFGPALLTALLQGRSQVWRRGVALLLVGAGLLTLSLKVSTSGPAHAGHPPSGHSQPAGPMCHGQPVM